jgi:4-alpha-glucanotransferase
MDSTASHIMQIEIFMAQQFLFERQWQRIRTYAQKLGISIMGDMPIYVGYHSADVWANRKSFLLVFLLFVSKQY